MYKSAQDLYNQNEMKSTIVIPPMWRLDNIERNIDICRAYTSGKFGTEQIAHSFHLAPRTVQKIVSQACVSRSIAESNKLLAPLRRHHQIRIPPELRPTKPRQKYPKFVPGDRVPTPGRWRLEMLRAQPFCTCCKGKDRAENALEIDHIDNNPANTVLSNLQVLCKRCNYLKWLEYRKAVTAQRELTKLTEDRKRAICVAYAAADNTTAAIAQKFGITTKSVQRVVKEAGMLRTRQESNRIARKLRDDANGSKHHSGRRYGLQNQSRLLEQLGMPTAEDD